MAASPTARAATRASPPWHEASSTGLSPAPRRVLRPPWGSPGCGHAAPGACRGTPALPQGARRVQRREPGSHPRHPAGSRTGVTMARPQHGGSTRTPGGSREQPACCQERFLCGFIIHRPPRRRSSCSTHGAAATPSRARAQGLPRTPSCAHCPPPARSGPSHSCHVCTEGAQQQLAELRFHSLGLGTDWWGVVPARMALSLPRMQPPTSPTHPSPPPAPAWWDPASPAACAPLPSTGTPAQAAPCLHAKPPDHHGQPSPAAPHPSPAPQLPFLQAPSSSS